MVNKRRKSRNRFALVSGIPAPLKWLIFPILAGLACWWSGLDASLAQLVYQPDNHTAWLLRQYGTWPGMGLTVLGLIIVLATGLHLFDSDERPTIHSMAMLTVLTTVLGAGLLAQVLVQEAVERPRPRESVLASTPTTELRGQSFPSGHAAIGFAIAAPAFIFAAGSRRRKTILAVGITWGLTLGAARMVLGAHYLGDVLAAMGLVLGSAALLAPLAMRIRRLPFWFTVLFIFTALLGIVLGNKFTLDLTLPQGTVWSQLNLPCTATLSSPHHPDTIPPSSASKNPILNVRLKGYGAPLSTLKLVVDNQGVVTLDTRQGLYHSLTCTATIALPLE